jgi:Kef-type K+ transport system membrane component KefB
MMLGATVLAFWLIVGAGEGLVAPIQAVEGSRHSSAHAVNVLPQVLLALAVVVIVARAVGAVFRRLGQPPVIGEVVAGIMLGPSLLGQIAPQLSARLLPDDVAPYLSVLAHVGVVLYMFLVGLELDTGQLRKRSHVSVAISHASIVTPFLLGSGLALWLYPRLSLSTVPFHIFALFLGVSMSVTAFPVLARILTDRGLHATSLGTIALTCAAVDDVSAWCLLAFLVGVVQARPEHILVTLALVAVYLSVALLVMRPAARWLAARYELHDDQHIDLWAVVLVALLLSALATELIGIHALFGAFLMGAIVPHDSRLAREIHTRLEVPVLVLLLPAFFAFTGMRTEIGLVQGIDQWAICVVIIVVASLGKFGGSVVAARLTGLDWRTSSAIGILMNTRGLMELIVLNVGLDLGVLTPTLFAMLVIMALVTTLATAPILDRLAVRLGTPA